jgi:hypothetical protein
MKKEKSPILPVIFYMLKTAKQEKPILFFSYFLNFLIEIIRTGTNLLLPKLIIDELFYILFFIVSDSFIVIIGLFELNLTSHIHHHLRLFILHYKDEV